MGHLSVPVIQSFQEAQPFNHPYSCGSLPSLLHQSPHSLAELLFCTSVAFGNCCRKQEHLRKSSTRKTKPLQSIHTHTQKKDAMLYQMCVCVCLRECPECECRGEGHHHIALYTTKCSPVVVIIKKNTTQQWLETRWSLYGKCLHFKAVRCCWLHIQ